MGKKTGPNPTDRAKDGTKRSLLTEADGIPVGIAVEGANRNDFKMVEETIESIPIRRPKPTASKRQPGVSEIATAFREELDYETGVW